jgi:putative sterol carrier protein
MKRQLFFFSGFLCLLFSGVAGQISLPIRQDQVATLSMTLGLAFAGGQVLLAYQYYRLTYFDWAYLGYFTAGYLTALFAPAAADYIFVQHAALSIFVLLSGVAIVPPLVRLPLFTYDFSKPDLPEAMWGTPEFKAINTHLTAAWAVIFLTGVGLTLIGYVHLFPGIPSWVFTGVMPGLLSLGVGLPLTKLYPLYYLKRKDAAAALQKGPQTDENENMDIAEFLQAMPGQYHADETGQLKAVIQFDITDRPDANMYFIIDGGQCEAVAGNTENPHLAIHTPAQVWLDISTGRTSGGVAFMEKKYTVDGDIGLLLKMPQMFQGAPVAVAE